MNQPTGDTTMKTTRWLAVLMIGTVTTAASAAAETDVSVWVNQLRDADAQIPASLKLIDVGIPAIKPLLDGACDDNGTLSFAASDALRRLVLRAREKGGAAYDRGEMCRVFIDVLKGDRRLPARELAVQCLGWIGRDEVVPVLSEALKDDALREHAIGSLQQVPGKAASQALAHFAKTASAVGDRRKALYVLGRRGCKISVTALLDAAKNKDVNVQAAAVEALGQAGDASALPMVLSLAERGAEQVRPVAVDACLRLAEAAVREGKKDAALAAYDKVGAVGGDALYRTAVIAGYAKVANKAAVARLLGMCGAHGAEADDQILRELTRMPGREVTAAIVGACAKAPTDRRMQLLTVLGKRRDPLGFSALIAAGRDGNEEIRGVAVRAMADTGDPGMESSILDALRKGTPRVQAAAADAYVVFARQLLKTGGGKDAVKVLGIYDEILGRHPETLGSATVVGVLEGVAGIADPRSIPAVERWLTFDNPGVRRAAIDAYLAIADKMDRTKSVQALAIYNRIVDMNAVPAGRLGEMVERMRSLGEKSDVPGRLGLITQWWLIGPWPSPDWSGFDKAFFPESEIDLAKTYREGDKELKWKPVVTGDSSGRINLRKSLADAENVVAYGYAEISSDTEQDVVFRTGSDDGMKLWVNGKQVFGTKEPRGLTVDQDAIPVHLVRGVNKVLIKVLNGGSAWEFCCRVTRSDGRPVGIRVRPAT